ncbi:MAG TPA: RNA polymerase sigma factor, partial [Pyrinomonadaceae bacterium]
APEPSSPYSLDYRLAQRAAAGDRDAFEEIYWRYHQRVFGICYRMSKNVSEAEDLTQQVFIQLFKKIGSFRGSSAFSTWLHRLTVNLVLMQFRKKKVLREAVTEDGILPENYRTSGSGQAGNQVIDRLLINEAIGKLPKGYRQMLILHDVCGYEHEEIAKMLDCAAGTSKSQLFKARRKLRKLLSGETGNANLKSAL